MQSNWVLWWYQILWDTLYIFESDVLVGLMQAKEKHYLFQYYDTNPDTNRVFLSQQSNTKTQSINSINNDLGLS